MKLVAQFLKYAASIGYVIRRTKEWSVRMAMLIKKRIRRNKTTNKDEEFETACGDQPTGY